MPASHSAGRSAPLSRRRFFTLGAGLVAAGGGLAACSEAKERLVGPASPVVARAEADRRAAGAIVRAVRLSAAPTQLDLGGRTVQTWAYGDRAPGREIRLKAGEVLKVDFRNDLPDKTTIHWHGIALRNDMDGVPGITQPPIAPGTSFTYEFTVPDPGTYWFHPHQGVQLDRALYAPLIVEDPADPGDYDEELVVVLDDWTDGVAGTPDEVLRRLRAAGTGGMAGMNMNGMAGMGGMGADPRRPLGTDGGDVKYPIYLANGKVPQDPQTVRSAAGRRMYVRLINAAADTAFRVAVGGSPLTVVATDGYPVEPVDTESLLIGMGERVDVVVKVPDGVTVLAAAPESKTGTAARVVLRAGAGRTPPVQWTPSELSKAPLLLASLTAAKDVRLPEAKTPPLMVELGMDQKEYRWTINGAVFEAAKPLVVDANRQVRLRLRNRTMMFHPMHLHGHTFQVRGAGSPAGPRKDTVSVLPMQSVDVDLVTDNPGNWLLHCHNIYHAEAGMMTRLQYRA